MIENKKLIIYYKPAEGFYEYVKSFTLCFSRINLQDDTYKKKVVLEHKSKKRNRVEEYKMKELHLNAKAIAEKIENIDFNKEYTLPTTESDEYCITYGDKVIRTCKKEEIQKILDMFNFEKLLSISHKHYEYIKDMDEYTKFIEILNSKIETLNGEQLTVLSRVFKDINPYYIFQSMGWLPKYLDDIKSKT